MKKTRKNTAKFPNTGSEAIPPGATRKAMYEPLNPGGGAPGSGAGPRHAADDPGSPNESYEATDRNEPLADDSIPEEAEPEQQGPYAGPSGGAVGGTPAESRSSGGKTGGGIKPGGVHRGDSTVGTDPDSGAE